MKNRKSIIIILLIIILALGTLAFYFSRLYTSVNKENNELKTKISNQESETKTKEAIIEDAKEPITEEKAIEIIEDYRKNTMLDNYNRYVFTEVKIENIDCTYKYFINENQFYISLQTPTQYRTLYNDKKSVIQAYAVYYSGGMDKMTGYVDLYTGEILGVYEEGI